MGSKKVDVRLVSHKPTLWFLSGTESFIQCQQGVHSIISPSDRQLSYELARIKTAEELRKITGGAFIICKKKEWITTQRARVCL